MKLCIGGKYLNWVLSNGHKGLENISGEIVHLEGINKGKEHVVSG